MTTRNFATIPVGALTVRCEVPAPLPRLVGLRSAKKGRRMARQRMLLPCGSRTRLEIGPPVAGVDET